MIDPTELNSLHPHTGMVKNHQHKCIFSSEHLAMLPVEDLPIFHCVFQSPSSE
jgi:hypothetical protein